jgi:hypothetical protein
MISGLTTVTATSALSRETTTKETLGTAEMRVEKRLKRLWMRTRETMKRLRSTSAIRWWLVWASGGRMWVLGSSKAVNVACLAVFDPSTNNALSQFLGKNKKNAFGVMWSGAHPMASSARRRASPTCTPLRWRLREQVPGRCERGGKLS